MKRFAKRTISLIVAVSLLGGMITIAYAKGNANISAFTKQEIKTGETIELKLKIKDNPGFCATQLDVVFNAKLVSFLGSARGNASTGKGSLFAANATNNTVSIAIVGIKPLSKDGIIATLKFKALAAGTLDFTINAVNFADKDENEMPISVNGVTVTVSSSEQEDNITVPTPSPSKKPETALSFLDVSQNYWAYNYIQSAVERGLFSGVGDNMFDPEGKITRGMFVTVLFRYDGGVASGTPKFKDVPPNAWYADGVVWANNKEIINGMGDGKFYPNLYISREQISVILYNYFGKPKVSITTLNEFVDKEKVSNWAQNAMAWAVNEGIISGKAGKRLDPLAFASRAETAAIFGRL
ncbi:MAG: S-layer homology domain-containing protein [Christensenellaceae bacterium]